MANPGTKASSGEVNKTAPENDLCEKLDEIMDAHENPESGKQEATPSPKKKTIKGFYHKDIFGEGGTETMGERKVLAEDIGNIPGTIEMWESDVVRRKKEIKKWKDQNVLQKISAKVAPSFQERSIKEITGEELLYYPPDKRVKKLIRALKKDPENVESRVNLVYEIRKSNIDTLFTEQVKEFPVKVYQSFLLQSTVALHFYEFSAMGLQVSLWAYGTYLQHLQQFMKTRVKDVEHKLNNEKKASTHTKTLLEVLFLMNTNIRILDAYRDLLRPVINTQDMRKLMPSPFSLNELVDFALGGSSREDVKAMPKAEQAKELIVQKALNVVNILGAMPLLLPVAQEIAQRLIRFDQHNPLVYLIQCRVCHAQIKFALKRFEAGDRSEENRDQIKQAFKVGHKHYRLAMKQMGSIPDKKDIILLSEFANFVLSFYSICQDVIAFTPPNNWFIRILNDAGTAVALALAVSDLSLEKRGELLHFQSKINYRVSLLSSKDLEQKDSPLDDEVLSQLDQQLQKRL
ncbi:hypothetical protein WDW89_19270 [Deltaproteobacteria bacterium TL4]